MNTKRNSGRMWWTWLALVLCGLLGSAPALAAPAPQPTASEPDIVITGKHYKPRLFIFIGKPKLNLDWSLDDPRFKRSFLDHTLDSVWSRPF